MNTFKDYLEIREGVNDPAIFKAVFLAGGPGSGKSFIVGKTGLTALGFKVVNSDDAFEAAMTKAGMETTPDNIFSVQGQEIRNKAKILTGTKQTRYIQGRLGLVIDGTGKDTEKIKKQAKSLKKLGYDVAMIFVNTDLQTAQDRNMMRPRTLPPAEVEKYWITVQKNIGAFQTLFGKKRFIVVDNSEGKDYAKETTRAYREMSKFSTAKPQNAIANKWIKSELKSKSDN